jgi:hypothetical protein
MHPSVEKWLNLVLGTWEQCEKKIAHINLARLIESSFDVYTESEREELFGDLPPELFAIKLTISEQKEIICRLRDEVLAGNELRNRRLIWIIGRSDPELAIDTLVEIIEKRNIPDKKTFDGEFYSAAFALENFLLYFASRNVEAAPHFLKLATGKTVYAFVKSISKFNEPDPKERSDVLKRCLIRMEKKKEL